MTHTASSASDTTANGQWLVKTIRALATAPEALGAEVRTFKAERRGLSQSALAEAWADRIVRLFASEGAATALPGIIPGLGTAVQVGVEVATVGADLAFMLRCMGRLVSGVAVIHGHDPETAYTRDFVYVLALWSGVMIPAREAAKRIATKVAVKQFDRHVTGAILQKINQRVGTTLLTKYGTKRGGLALGRLIPFGVGALVGGGANYATMSHFRKETLRYYGEQLDLEMAAGQ